MTGFPAWAQSYFSKLPESYVGGVHYDLRGLVQLNSGSYDTTADAIKRTAAERLNRDLPNQMSGIPVAQKATRIHFLHSALWGRTEPSGTQVAHYDVCYEDDSSERIPIKQSLDMADWACPGDIEDPESIGWQQTTEPHGTIGLSQKTWMNLHPDKRISHIDFVSEEVQCAPFLVAITLE